ncbi:MAG: cohesin domain-containing protein [bacterium]
MKDNAIIFTFLLMASLTQAEGLSIGTTYEGAAGETVKAQVVLDASTPVASAQIQINYDPILLKVLSVTNTGAVGSQFIMGFKDHYGSLDVVLACSDGSCSQSGVLFEILFQLNAGASLGSTIDLIIARSDLGGDYGRNLASQVPLTVNNGIVSVVPSSTLDTDGDGIPDSWAWRYFNTTTNIVLKADPDGDGMDNDAEYKAGTDPNDRFSVFKITHSEAVPALDKPCAGFMVKWQSVTGKRYRVERTTDLRSAFEPIATGVEAVPPENTYMDLSATNAPACFYRITVDSGL